ncbi:MAG: hypothetical protein U0166_05510 [Acidobacteriota bacterium]
MITGYNTEIKHRGRLFHVQTEDKGLNNPVIESLIYIGGEILDSIRSSYKERITPDFERAHILKLMEEQHYRTLQTIKDGKYDPESEVSAAAVGDSFITSEHTLDEVILSVIAGGEVGLPVAEEKEPDRLEIELLHAIKPVPGASLALELVARSAISGNPLTGARVTIRLVSRSEKALMLFEGETDKDGLCVADIDIPNRPFEAGAIVIQASCEAGYDEIRKPLS